MSIVKEKHPELIKINEDATIWRYLDLEKFESLLRDKALFFCRVDKFSDPFEGSVPKREAEYRMWVREEYAIANNIPYTQKTLEDSIGGISSFHKDFKTNHIVNCWHINLGESDAMWRLYLKDNEGVAIQTTPQKLFTSLEGSTEKIYSSKVRYLNYETQNWFNEVDYPIDGYNMFIPLVHKRNEFIHESEFRLITEVEDAFRSTDYWDNQPNHKGKLIPIDVKELVGKIIFPPTIDQRTKDKIIALVAHYGYSFNFEDSKLSVEPIY